MAYKHSELTQGIIAAFYAVYNGLGYGFLEKVYENALAIELRKHSHICSRQVRDLPWPKSQGTDRPVAGWSGTQGSRNLLQAGP